MTHSNIHDVGRKFPLYRWLDWLPVYQ
jgi:hypothetical protein